MAEEKGDIPDLKAKVRTVSRRHFSKSANVLESLINACRMDVSKQEEMQACHRVVKDNYIQLTNYDTEIQHAIISSEPFDEVRLENEISDAGKYRARWSLLDTKYSNLLKTFTKSNHEANENRRFKLPTLDVKKFDGHIKNWLPFWGQFKKIDADDSIDECDKLQYLCQSMEPGTGVRKFVENFPIQQKSYISCLEELKSRYAREDLLIQLYVRELLTLVLKKENNLTYLYDNICSHLRSLEVLNVTSDKYSPFLLPIVESALPSDILRVWERQKPDKVGDELSSLLEFIKKEVETSQRITLANDFDVTSTKAEPTAACLTVNNQPMAKKQVESKCIFCDRGHPSTECFKVANMSVEERRELLRKKKACALCLKMGHHAKQCRSFVKCFICKQRHSALLCTGRQKPNEEKVPEPATTVQNYSANTTSVTTLLQTVAVNICQGEESVTVRALFDSGSQRSYIKEEVMKKLGVQPVGTEGLTHSLFGGNSMSFKNYNNYGITVQSIDKTFNVNLTALGQETICKNVPKVNMNNKTLCELLKRNQIILTDINESSDIGLLIGADYSGLLLTNNFIQLGSGLTAIKTNLGWTLQGKIQDAIINTNMVSSLLCLQSVPDFWNLEILGIQDPVHIQSKQKKEEEVLKSFEDSVRRNEENRYEVQLPWKDGHDSLLDNREIAFRRLESATNKLKTCGKFQDYNDILQEWERTAIIEPVPPTSNKKSNVHYLPHRAVSKESSLTTKLRPVYDASAKDKNGKSLNACLEKGMNFIDKIPDLLIGFRKGLIGVSADIAKAFLQISINPDDRDNLRFLWWKDFERREIIEYRHCRVVFGLTSSPFLLSATIQHHLEQIRGKYKETADILASSFYVDNLVISQDTEEATLNFINEAKEIMQEAKFDLRQWVTSPLKINETEKRVISVLGIMWDTVTDELLCNLQTLPHPSQIGKLTKRSILSLTQRIFDPIGILCPITLVPRLILQEIWNKKLAWDDELPSNIETQFHEWYDNMYLLENCRIPRSLSTEPLQECSDVSLHLFVDASKDGYAACVFLRTVDSKGQANWADLPSRGCNSRQLLESRWWEGPPWLRQQAELWPHSALVVDEKEACKELRKTVHVNTCCNEGMTQDLSYFSKYSKIVRVTAWMLRFIYNTHNKKDKKKGELTFDEYEAAEKKLLQIIQAESKDDIQKHIKKLTTFNDNDNILRIKTKLILTDFPEEVKTPAVLPAENVITRRLVEQRHLQLLHAGTNIMITDLRKRFWIVGIRRLVKSVIDKCVICRRHRAKATQVSTAPLPIERIQPLAPFEVTGVNLAGPIYLRGDLKSWIVIYTCAVYRAIHLELTLSLSTDAFIRTFRRFIARRGRPNLMISDNGTNFTGTKNLLTNLDWDEVQRVSSIMRIKWKLNSPTAAWWGGFFERMIKIVKNILRRVLGMSTVSYDEMETLLCDCESVVNDRPLTYVEADDADALEPLRPSCFIQPLPQSQVTDFDILDAKSMNHRLRYLHKIRGELRTRFNNEYLTELVQRGREKCGGIKVGDVVLVESEERRVKWPLGLVVQVYTGKDGVDRTAKVKTMAGFKVRPFQRLYQLELSSSEVEERQEVADGHNSLGKQYYIVLNPSSTVSNKRAAVAELDDGPTIRQKAVTATRLGRIIKLPSKYSI
ncbi:uncharacterized protein LOC106718201 isoform X2 [Papilio machaon]|uniref:uncharacterized protein LOC106718201 isoform X2 n=1 Tax=Papilio machaon TaxID=76193 RepID=UPI001E663612|nr:uncharacterized protein LOC106718201 isoform X2 [Papilio machaon]